MNFAAPDLRVGTNKNVSRQSICYHARKQKKLYVKHQCSKRYWIFTLELWKLSLFLVWNIVARKFLKVLNELLLVFFSAWLLSKLSWLNLYSIFMLIGFYIVLSYSYIKVIYCFIASTSPDTRAEVIQDPVLLHTFLNTFCWSVELAFEKVKKEIFKCSIRCFIRSIQANSRLRSSLLAFQVKTNTTRD